MVDVKEVCRYLGLRGSAPDDGLLRLIDECLADLRQAATPRYVYRRFPIERPSAPGLHAPDGNGLVPTPGNAASGGAPDVPENMAILRSAMFPAEKPDPGKAPGASPDEPSVLRIAGAQIRSRSLSRNLRGCREAVLMAATLGLGPDRLIARASVGRMSRAVVLQAASAAMIEAWCDSINRRIRLEAGRDGLSCRPRFSPGYGDFPLAFQQKFEQILHMQKEIGVSLTESLLMMPSKSVTAIIGLSRADAGCVPGGCEDCGRRESCAFSRITV